MLTGKNDGGVQGGSGHAATQAQDDCACGAGLTSGPAAAGGQCTARALAHPQPPLLPVLPVQQPLQLLPLLLLHLQLMLLLPFQGCPS